MKLKHHLFLVSLWLILLAPPAHAYLDPGTMSIVLQAIIGAVATVLVVGRSSWTRIKQFFGGATVPEEVLDDATKDDTLDP